MNPLDQERAVRKAVECLQDANLHIQNADTLDQVTKLKATAQINATQQLLIIGWARSEEVA